MKVQLRGEELIAALRANPKPTVKLHTLNGRTPDQIGLQYAMELASTNRFVGYGSRLTIRSMREERHAMPDARRDVPQSLLRTQMSGGRYRAKERGAFHSMVAASREALDGSR